MMAHHVTLEAAAEVVREWFDRVKLASLDLPSGSLGAGRNLHQLTDVIVTTSKLILVLDHQLVLLFTEPSEPVSGSDELVFSRFTQLVFDWQEYGNMTPHAEVFREGAVRFRAQPGAPASGSATPS
jgi:hypothetical protein